LRCCCCCEEAEDDDVNRYKASKQADVLMLFQAANCNRQIPAKLYEYLYVGQPVIGFTDPAGDTGQLMNELGIEAIAPLDDVAAIKKAIVAAMHDAASGTARVPSRDAVMRYSRAGTTKQLAVLLDEVASGGAGESRLGAVQP